MTDTMLEHSYPGAGARSSSAKTVLSCNDRITAKLRSQDWNSQLAEVSLSPHTRNEPTGPVKLGKESPVKKDSLSSGGHQLQLKTSPSAHSRHSAVRGGPTREKPATIPRESSPSKARIRYENHFNRLLIIVKKNNAKKKTCLIRFFVATKKTKNNKIVWIKNQFFYLLLLFFYV